MIVTEIKDNLLHTYSDTGFTIIQDITGIEYIDAYDPIDSGRTYKESDRLIVEKIGETPQIMTEEDKVLIQAAKTMLGLTDESGDE